jgi:hypothetical protein
LGAIAACLTLGFLPLDGNLSGPSRVHAQGAAVNIYVDRAANEDFLANLEINGFVYEAKDGRLQLADPDIMNAWKGNGPIRRFITYEDTAQFAPVFLVVDVMNNGPSKLGIVGGYLEVAESATDLSPYLYILSEYDPGCAADLKLNPEFEFVNHGWGPVENAKITYAFGTEAGPAGQSFVAEAGTFGDAQKVSVLPGLEASGLDVSKAAGGTFACPSREQVQACVQRLGPQVLGALSNAVFLQGNSLFTRVSGNIDFPWTDSHGGKNARSVPFSVDIPVLAFDIPAELECGAGGPVERTFKTVKLPLDRVNYRIPLPYQGTLAPQQNARAALGLIADKSSSHKFRVVLRPRRRHAGRVPADRSPLLPAEDDSHELRFEHHAKADRGSACPRIGRLAFAKPDRRC